MTKKILTTSVVTAMTILLVGCGGSNDTTPIATGEAFYLDSAVSGINYKCGTQEGITNAEGAFTFDVGSSCTFYLGDIELRSIAANVLKDGENVVEDDVKIAQLLQTLDVDGDPSNGITVSAAVVEAMAISLNANGGDGTLPDTEEELHALSAELETEVPDYQGHAVTQTEAEEHLATTQAMVDAQELKAFFAGRTLYHINDQNEIETVVFNSDATTLQFGTEAAVNIYFGAHSIIDKDGEHIIAEITDEYVKGYDSYGEFIFYTTEAGAQAALSSQGNTTNTQSLQELLKGKTFYNINDQGVIETVVFNSEGTTLQFGTEAAVNITFGEHSIIDKDGEHIIAEITDEYVKGYDSYGEFIFYTTEAGAQAALSSQANTDIGYYTVYGGNESFSGGFREMPSSYSLIGSGNTSKTFNAQYKYYVIANENSHTTIYIDAVKGSNNQYYGTYTTSNTGDTWQNLEGAPDQKYVSIGAYGYILIDSQDSTLNGIEVIAK